MILALYQPDIPQNTGTIMRLAACMGVPLHIIEPCGFILDDNKLKRAVMDYADRAEIIRHTSWGTFDEWRKSTHKRLILLTTQASTAYTDFAFSSADILLLGRESSGAPPDVHNAASDKIKIPMHKGARSLNVALAASMVLGEAIRQTR